MTDEPTPTPAKAALGVTSRDPGAPAWGRSGAPHAVDPHLEGIRGYAALAVMLFHLCIASGAPEVLNAFGWLCDWIDAGMAVKIFFVLSGYVIGMTTIGVAPTRPNIASYCQRRALRLFPINFFGVLMGCAASTSLSWATVVGSLFFLENYSGYGQYFLPPPDANGNLWTLNYEALFYLLFILVWRLKPRAEVLFAGCLLLAVVFYRTTAWLSVSCYACGFLFWLSGLYLARSRGPAGAHAGRLSASALILLVVTPKIQDFHSIFLAYVPWSWSVPIFPGAIMRPYDLGVLPVCVILIAEAAGVTFRGLWLVRATAYLIAVHGFLHIRGTPAGLPAAFYGLMLFAALFAWRLRMPARLLSCAAWLGSISFAFYAIGYPIQQWVFRVRPALHIPEAVKDMAIVISVAIAFAWFLEKRVQPWIKSLFPRVAPYRQGRPGRDRAIPRPD
jgi:peptidoglycan/LPS O-acetylase OafA/YrhL